MKKGNRGKRQAGRKMRDITSKTVLGNPVLCAQFLRDNVKVPMFQEVMPEDIEDISERYIPYLGTEFTSDTVKRIYFHKEAQKKYAPLFLISLTEHKSRVDYDVSMQLLKYIMCIWTEYGKEMEQKKEGITGRKSFRYPVIIPVVYYEGKAPWTADRNLSGRISCKDLFVNWIPDFSYEVVRLHDYTDEELLGRNNEMALIMMINKIQDVSDLSDFLKLPAEKLNQIVKDTPENILEIIASVIESLCIKIGAANEETRECVRKVKERRMGCLFESIEKMDIQAERRNTAKAREEAEKAREDLEKAEIMAEKKVVKAQEKAIRAVIKVCKKVDMPREQIIAEVMENFHINRKAAEEKVDYKYEQ